MKCFLLAAPVAALQGCSLPYFKSWVPFIFLMQVCSWVQLGEKDSSLSGWCALQAQIRISWPRKGGKKRQKSPHNSGFPVPSDNMEHAQHTWGWRIISWEALKLRSAGAAEGKNERLSLLCFSYMRLQLSAKLPYSAVREEGAAVPPATIPAPLCCWCCQLNQRERRGEWLFLLLSVYQAVFQD